MPVNLRVTEAPFERVSVPYGDTGTRREVARYTCGCGKQIDIPIKTGQGISTDLHRRSMTQKGWQLSSRATSVTCPDCISKEKESMAAAAEKMPATTADILPMQRAPTPDQRLKIRSALDTHFDDSAGMYLGEQSDQTIADSLGIPRAWVETIREAAYGPIRITPEVLALRKDVETARSEYAALGTTLAELEARLARIERVAG